MFGFLVPSYSPDTSQQDKHVTALSSDLQHKQMTTPSDLFTDTLTIKLLTHIQQLGKGKTIQL